MRRRFRFVKWLLLMLLSIQRRSWDEELRVARFETNCVCLSEGQTTEAEYIKTSRKEWIDALDKLVEALKDFI